jgi:cell division protein ZapA (FtsZ GTPase activity inhibitor)
MDMANTDNKPETFLEKKRNIDIIVGGEKFSFLVSSENESILRQAAKRVEQEIIMRRQNSTIKNTERVAIMVALNAASDLLLQQQKNDTLPTDAAPYLDALEAKLEAMNAHADEVINKLSINLY